MPEPAADTSRFRLRPSITCCCFSSPFSLPFIWVPFCRICECRSSKSGLTRYSPSVSARMPSPIPSRLLRLQRLQLPVAIPQSWCQNRRPRGRDSSRRRCGRSANRALRRCRPPEISLPPFLTFGLHKTGFVQNVFHWQRRTGSLDQPGTGATRDHIGLGLCSRSSGGFPLQLQLTRPFMPSWRRNLLFGSLRRHGFLLLHQGSWML